MNLSDRQQLSTCSNLNIHDQKQHCIKYDQLQLHNLPKEIIISKFDLVKFCFLVLGISNDAIRPFINYSKITDQFWYQLRKLRGFQETFKNFNMKEVYNVYKYIHYFKINNKKKYGNDIVIKAFYLLVERGEIDEGTSMADIGNILLKFLKFNTRKNGRNKDIALDKINILYHYVNSDTNVRLCQYKFIDNIEDEVSLPLVSLKTNNLNLDLITPTNIVELREAYIIKDEIKNILPIKIYDILQSIYNESNNSQSNNFLSDFIIRKSNKAATYKINVENISTYINSSNESIEYVKNFKRGKFTNYYL